VKNDESLDDNVINFLERKGTGHVKKSNSSLIPMSNYPKIPNLNAG
jgi:hypothetical protein